MDKERLDTLVQRKAAVSRSKAQGLIHTGCVFTPDGERLNKPGLRLPPDTPLDIRESRKYVSRGGEKLEAAFEAFQPSVEGAICLDAGASTGGFTDCLLQHGAAKVYAVDVGYGQLAWELRRDPRVHVFERTNIRFLEPVDIGELSTFFTIDCSFISLELVFPAVDRLVQPAAQGIALIKPQFEAGKDQVGKGGVVRDVSIQEEAVQKVVGIAERLGYQCLGTIPSPVLGPAGNREFLAWFQGGGTS